MKPSYLVLFFVLFSVTSCIPIKKNVIAYDDSLTETDINLIPKAETILRLQNGDHLTINITYIDPITGLNVDVLNEAGFDRQNEGIAIDQNGEINLPQFDRLKLTGLTLDQTQTALYSLIEKKYSDPNIQVSLLNCSVTIIGEVSQPGTYPILETPTTILKAIGLAGGLNAMANIEEIKIIRSRGDSTSVYFLNLHDAQFLRTPQYYVLPGDVILIKPLSRKLFTAQETTNIFRGLGVMLSALSLVIAISKL